MELDEMLCEIEKDLYNLQYQSESLGKYRLSNHWEVAKYTFLNKDESRFIFVRNHVGSYLAFGMATHNIYNMRQRIIKQAIYLTKSNNPNAINQQFQLPLGTMYFCLLTMLWHIPSFSAELAFRTYVSIQAQLFLLYFPSGSSIVEQAGLENIII